jgi:hypothetical protein
MTQNQRDITYVEEPPLATLLKIVLTLEAELVP